ncbi:MAG: 2-phospho-L-lactate guanylyltransferase [Pseudomonadales bacterium]|nr:2-phospho-L-lactate guanylyltransferase [Pseudomonadales bacterium]
MQSRKPAIWAVVPLKGLERAKQRLASVLDADERRALMLAMARDVLTSLARSTRLAGTLIVSRTVEADALAQAFGTERFAESPDADLSAALTQAAAYLHDRLGADGVFIVPADIPLVSAGEIDLALADHTGVTIMPDDENLGTNGLILTPTDAIPLVFDGKSFKPHLDAAEQRGIPPTIHPLRGFALDIDTPADLRTLLVEGGRTQTGIYLDRSGIAERLSSHHNGAPLTSDTGTANA